MAASANGSAAASDARYDSVTLEESDGDAEEGGFSTETSHGSMDLRIVDLKTPQGCKPWFSAKCYCHMCYVLQFCIYIVVFPLWCKYLVTAPMPYEYWNEGWPRFPTIEPLEKTYLALRVPGPPKGPPQIDMSPVPEAETACNYSCSTDYYGYQTDEMNFKVSLTLNNSHIMPENAHTLFPVILTSPDFRSWMLVADRRNAEPEPFWRNRDRDRNGQSYSLVTETCARQPSQSYGLEAAYIFACVTWNPTRLRDLVSSDIFNASDLGNLCDAAGGVCGWPCGSPAPPTRLSACSLDGVLDVAAFARHIDNASFQGTVTVGACETLEGPMSMWRCHQCQRTILPDEPPPEDDGLLDDGDAGLDGLIFPDMTGGGLEPPDMTGGGGFPGDTGGLPPGLPPMPRRRRLRRRRQRTTPPPDDEEEDTSTELFESLPRMMVHFSGVDVPQGLRILTSPRAFLLSAPTLGGPFVKVYAPPNLDPDAPPRPTPVGVPPSTRIFAHDADTNTQMAVHDGNRLDVRPSSCFGRRGPLYVVACAVNVTTYQAPRFNGFEPGQEIAPPPFNDRCLAVAGRCGSACQPLNESGMPYCLPNGYINQSHLVAEIEIQNNKQIPVYAFVYVLLFGFSVKLIMLCPGIFSPYAHCHHYYPELTEQLRYIVTCTPSTAGDENKSTTIRNLIGCVSAMPKGTRCRYHVVLLDETHRVEMRQCWSKFGNILAAVPNFGGGSYDTNLAQFMHMWVEDTKKLDLKTIGDKSKVLEQGVLERMSGRATLKKMKFDSAWSSFTPQSLARFEAALEEFEQDVKNDNKWSRVAPHRDDVADWEPEDRSSSMLRMHYVARAKPIEDERTNRVQHVAPGTWYYKVPLGASIDDWLALRGQAREMIYGSNDDVNQDDAHIVPLRTSRGKAGGLNFVENYMLVVAERPENASNDGRDEAPCLYTIADARHQFQPDFMTSTIPYFFRPNGTLDEEVGFTQCPQHFHESQDKSDYLDTNNAQFFRLNCMIRNCSGGASSCGTNGTWMIKHDDNSSIWESERVRVRDYTHRKRMGICERRTFHESCKVEDTASSLQQVVQGRHSQFINRKLSYGMAKEAVGYLAATQRWAEGGVVLSLQTFTTCGQGHWMVFVTLFLFIAFIISLIRLVTLDSPTWMVVQLGLASETRVDALLAPVTKTLDFVIRLMWDAHLLGTGVRDPTVYTHSAVQLVMWLFMLIGCLLCLWCITTTCKIFRRRCCLFPDQLRWCARLLITMDNLIYFVWFWTAFFWIGFNYYTVLTRSQYHFQFEGMMTFMVLVNLLNWGMIISNSFRYSLEQSMEANEVAFLSMDNIWRANQLFYMTAPVQLFSILAGIKEFIRYKCYGIDISYWEGGDRGEAAITLVKWWTLLLVLGPIAAWTCYILFSHQYLNAQAACVVVTIIGMDVLHPCTYLWVGQSKLTREEARAMTWAEALTSGKWWQRCIYLAILNPTLTGFLKYVGPAYFVLIPLLLLASPYYGVNGAFMLINTGHR